MKEKPKERFLILISAAHFFPSSFQVWPESKSETISNHESYVISIIIIIKEMCLKISKFSYSDNDGDDVVHHFQLHLLLFSNDDDHDS